MSDDNDSLFGLKMGNGPSLNEQYAKIEVQQQALQQEIDQGLHEPLVAKLIAPIKAEMQVDDSFEALSQTEQDAIARYAAEKLVIDGGFSEVTGIWISDDDGEVELYINDTHIINFAPEVAYEKCINEAGEFDPLYHLNTTAPITDLSVGSAIEPTIDPALNSAQAIPDPATEVPPSQSEIDTAPSALNNSIEESIEPIKPLEPQIDSFLEESPSLEEMASRMEQAFQKINEGLEAIKEARMTEGYWEGDAAQIAQDNQCANDLSSLRNAFYDIETLPFEAQAQSLQVLEDRLDEVLQNLPVQEPFPEEDLIANREAAKIEDHLTDQFERHATADFKQHFNEEEQMILHHALAREAVDSGMHEVDNISLNTSEDGTLQYSAYLGNKSVSINPVEILAEVATANQNAQDLLAKYPEYVEDYPPLEAATKTYGERIQEGALALGEGVIDLGKASPALAETALVGTANFFTEGWAGAGSGLIFAGTYLWTGNYEHSVDVFRQEYKGSSGLLHLEPSDWSKAQLSEGLVADAFQAVGEEGKRIIGAVEDNFGAGTGGLVKDGFETAMKVGVLKATGIAAREAQSLASKSLERMNSIHQLKQNQVVRVTQFYDPEKGSFPLEGKYALHTSPLKESKFGKLVDGIKTDTTWVAPFEAENIGSLKRIMTGVGDRTHYIEFNVKMSELANPGGVKGIMGPFQKVILEKVDLSDVGRAAKYGVMEVNPINNKLVMLGTSAVLGASGYKIYYDLSKDK